MKRKWMVVSTVVAVGLIAAFAFSQAGIATNHAGIVGTAPFPPYAGPLSTHLAATPSSVGAVHAVAGPGLPPYL